MEKLERAQEEDKRKKELEESNKQAKEDLDAAVKLGHLAPYSEPPPKAEEKKATDSKKKEG